MTPEQARDALVTTLEQLGQIFPLDKANWDSRLVVRLAVERLWITAGNLAEAYRLGSGIESGVEPWSGLVGYRHLLAHALTGDISSDRVYADTSADLARLANEVRRVP